MINYKAFRSLTLLCASLMLPLVFIGGQVDASVQVGSLIRFQDGPGGSGGEFGIAHSSTPSLTEFVTFCVEKNEYINFSSTYYVDSIQMEADAGGNNTSSGDPVDARTAWLYYNFRNQTLAGYNYGGIGDSGNSARVASANAFQNAVWNLEQEQASAGTGQAFVDAANAEFALYNDELTYGPYTGNMGAAVDSVRIMNIRLGSANGARSQSQLFLVPEPTSILAWSFLAIGLVGIGRRRVAVK